MSASLYLSAHFVKAEIGKLVDLYPDLADDDLLRADAIEGETDAHRIIERALLERQEAEMMVSGIKNREALMAERRARFERKSEAMKVLIRSIMKAAKLDRLQLTEATLSITKGRASVGIENLDDLPQGFFHTKREADKAAIKTALEAGHEVPGAILVTGSEGLTIRAK